MDSIVARSVTRRQRVRLQLRERRQRVPERVSSQEIDEKGTVTCLPQHVGPDEGTVTFSLAGRKREGEMKYIQSALMVGIVFSSFLTVGLARPNEMRCNYTTRFSCNPKGCDPVPEENVLLHFLIVPHPSELRQFDIHKDQIPEIRRCDTKGCNPVAIIPRHLPARMNMEGAESTYFFAVNTLDLEFMGARLGHFMEIATLLDVVFVAYGTCPLHEEELSKDGGK